MKSSPHKDPPASRREFLNGNESAPYNASRLHSSAVQPMKANEITHLLIDLDGTLLGVRDIPLRIHFTHQIFVSLQKYGSFTRTYRAIRAMFKELGIPSLHLNNDQRAIQAFAEQMKLPVHQASELIHEIITKLFPTLERFFYPIESAQDFVIWAKDHYSLILATNPVWKEEIVKIRVRWAGLDPALFKLITHSEKMHACKPSKEYYREILELESVSHQNCLLVGNDPKKDLPAALAGIPVFIFSKGAKLKPLKIRGQKAPAWKGDFNDLKSLLRGD